MCFENSENTFAGVAIRRNDGDERGVAFFEQSHRDTGECRIRLLDTVFVLVRCPSDERPNVVHDGGDGTVRVIEFEDGFELIEAVT